MNKLLLFFFFLIQSIGFAFSIENPISVYVSNYNVKDYKASCQSWGFTLTEDGYLYVANNSGLLRFDGNTWVLFPTPDNDEVTAITHKGDTIYTKSPRATSEWVYDQEGLLHHSYVERLPEYVDFTVHMSDIPFEIPDEIKDAKVSAVTTNGEFYFIGTLTSGVFILDRSGRMRQHLSLDNQLQDNIVSALFVQDKNHIWIAMDNGISKIQIHPSAVLLAQRSIIGKLENAGLNKSDLYLKTNVGYYKYDLKSFKPFEPVPEDEALLYLRSEQENEVLWLDKLLKQVDDLDDFSQASSISAAGNGLYWLSMNNEVALFEMEGNNSSLKCRLLFDNYNMNLVTKGNRVFPLDETLVLFSTMQGLLLMDVREEISQSLSGYQPLKVAKMDYIDDEGTHNMPIKSDKVMLPYDFKAFNIQIGTTVMTSENQISYKIEGVSNSWSEWQKDGRISFWQLPEGQYILKVRKYSVQGPSAEFSLPIEVRPAWYNSVWAWLVYTVLGVFLVRRFFLYHLHILKKEELNRLRNEQKLLRQQKEKEEKELLEKELQKKTEELTGQTAALLKRNQDIQHILEELDAQKEQLGDRYPNKYYLRLRQLVEDTKANRTEWKLIESSFDRAHQNFTERLCKQYSDITPGDLRICCLLRMNLSTKEIASLMNISVRAVELRRYRLRKRLGLDADINLVDFLIQF